MQGSQGTSSALRNRFGTLRAAQGMTVLHVAQEFHY